VGLDHGMILNFQLTCKKFLQRHMKIMHKPGIIDDSGPVDITETYF
jgi:hypothetical protein